MVRKLTVSLMSMMFILVPSMAFAVDMEFYTYGGFDAVVNAFVQLVMIFGNSSYQTLYYSAVVCGIAGGATVAFVKLVAGMHSNILGWAPIAALGMAIYVGLFVPKGNLTIYDPVFNKFQTVANVPNGVVIIAGTMNAIERGLVDIVSNSASPDAFQTQAGGKGFLGLFNLVTTPITAVDTNLDSSMIRYIDDCAGFALNNSSSGLTVNELRKNTTSFSTSLAKAANPANFTVFYNAANPNGQTMTCRDAWIAITTAMTPAALQGNTNAQCSTLGFDVTSAAERIQCQTMLYNSQNVSALGAASLDAFVQQSYIAQKLDYVFRSGDGTAATNYQFMMNASGSMKAANDWLPILRAVLTAIAVALIPFLCIFLPTPICGRVLGMMFGLFVWLTTWGVTDAIMHQFAMNHAYKLMELIRQNKLGMDALLFFPTQAAKTLSMFGTMRMGGLVLATALSGMLVKFGGHAMAMLAGNITGQIQGAGVKGESQTADPTGRAQSITSNTSAMPTQAWANGHSWNARTSAARAEMDYKTGHGMGMGGEGFSQGMGGSGESFSQGYNSAKVSMGNTDAYAKSNLGPRLAAATGMSMTRAPEDMFGAKNTGQQWIQYGTPDGSLQTVASGNQSLTMSNGNLTGVSGMPFRFDTGDAIKRAYSEKIGDATQEALSFTQTTGRNLARTLSNTDTRGSITSDMAGLVTSFGGSHTQTSALKNTFVTMADKSSSIKDEHGRTVSKESFGTIVAQARASLGLEALGTGGKVGSTGESGYRVSVKNQDGTTSTYSVNFKDSTSAERALGEAWINTQQQLKSSTLTSGQQASLLRALQVSDTKTSSEQASQTWSRVQSLQREEASEISKTAAAGQDGTAALIRLYGDTHYGHLAPAERYANAASDLTEMANSGKQGDFKAFVKSYVDNKSAKPEHPTYHNTPWGVETQSLQRPEPPPISFESIPQRIKQSKEEIGSPDPLAGGPSNVKERIDSANPEHDIALPSVNPSFGYGDGRPLDEMRDDMKQYHGNMDTSMPYHLIIGHPTAEGMGEGKSPSGNTTLRGWYFNKPVGLPEGKEEALIKRSGPGGSENKPKED
jgi:hypothetical protein